MTSNPYGYSLDRASMVEESPLYLASLRKARLRYTTDTGGTHLGPTIDLSRESDQYSFGQALASRGVALPRNASAYMVKGHEGYDPEHRWHCPHCHAVLDKPNQDPCPHCGVAATA